MINNEIRYGNIKRNKKKKIELEENQDSNDGELKDLNTLIEMLFAMQDYYSNYEFENLLQFIVV